MEKSRIGELDVVALTRDISETYLKKGDLGTVVLVYGDYEGYMVEFVVQTGFTAALIDLAPADVRHLSKAETTLERLREWKPEWTSDELGYVPPISELPEWYVSQNKPCPDAHYLANVDGAAG